MNTYYLVLSLLFAVTLPCIIYERSRSYMNSSFGVNKVLFISVGVALMLAGIRSYYSFLGSIFPALLLMYFATYRVELKKFTSTPEFIGATFGKSTRIIFGAIFAILAFLLVYEQLVGFFNLLEECSRNLKILFSVVGVYFILLLTFGSVELLVWHQVMLLITFMVFCLVNDDSGKSMGIAKRLVGKFRMISSVGLARGKWSSLLLFTPFQTQILWLFKEQKYARRTYKIGIGFMVYLVIINLFASDLVGATYLRPVSLVGELQDLIRSSAGFYLGAMSYQLFIVIPLLYLGSHFFINDVMIPLGSNRVVSSNSSSMKTVTILGITMFSLFLSYAVRTPFPWAGLVVDLLLLSFQIPFLAAVANLVTNRKELYLSILITYIVYGILAFVVASLAWIPILSGVVAGGLTFVIVHYYNNGGFVFHERSYRARKIIEDSSPRLLERVKSFFRFPFARSSFFRNNVDYHGAPYNTVSCFLVFFFLFAPMLFNQAIIYQNALKALTTLCGIGFFFAILLFLYPCWPNFLAKFFPVYWHLTLVYSLSFFPVFSYLMLGYPVYWLVIISFSTLILARFLAGNSFLFLHLLGSGFSFLLCKYVMNESAILVTLLNNRELLTTFSLTYVVSLLLGYILLNNRQYTLDYTEKALNHLSQEFLHLNTNVVAMAKTPASIVSMLLESKLEEVKKSENGNVTFELDPETYSLLREHVGDIRRYIDIGSEVIRRRSRYFSPIKGKEFSDYSALNCVESAIDIFKRIDTSYNSPPEIILEEDFTFYGSSEHLEQVILNLIACTFAHCGQDVRKEIIIKKGKIVYQYHGKVIPVKERPYLFTYLLYSQKSTGYYKEVGALAYVKRVMSAFGGDVVCSCHVDKAPEKNYTRFTLYLPNLSEPAPK